MNLYPASVKELFEDDSWRRKISIAISKYRIQDEPEDVMSEIFLLMLSRQDPDGEGRDYVQRWDSKKTGSFSNWIYTFVRNYCIKKFARSSSKGGRLIEGAARITVRDKDQETQERGTVSEDEIPSVNMAVDEVELRQTFDTIVSIVKVDNPTNSWVEYVAEGYFVCTVDGRRQFHKDQVDEQLVGHRINRDMATVLEALMQGLEPSEIASIFKTSRQFVYTLLERLRESEDVVSFRDQVWVEQNNRARVA